MVAVQAQKLYAIARPITGAETNSNLTMERVNTLRYEFNIYLGARIVA